MPKQCVLLPPNQVRDKKNRSRSVYGKDYNHARMTMRKATPSRYTSDENKLIQEMKKMQMSDNFDTFPAALLLGYERDDVGHPTKNHNKPKKNQLLQKRPKSLNHNNLRAVQDDLLRTRLMFMKEGIPWPEENPDPLDYILRGQTNSNSFDDRNASRANELAPVLDDWFADHDDYDRNIIHDFVSKMSEAYCGSAFSRPKTCPIGPTPSRRGNRSNKSKTPAATASLMRQFARNPPIRGPHQIGGPTVPTNSQFPSFYDVLGPGYLEETKVKMGKKKKKTRVIDPKERIVVSPKSNYGQPKEQTKKLWTEQEFLHPGATFKNVKPKRKGFFTIHPEFVSEEIKDLKRKDQLQYLS